MDNYQSIETFIRGIPADFDAWNTTDKINYYGFRVYGFQDFTDSEQLRIAKEFSTEELSSLLQIYTVPKVLGMESSNLTDVKTAKVFLGWGIDNLGWILEQFGVFNDTGTNYTAECRDYQQEYNQFITFLLVPTFVFALFVSMLKTRKSLYLHVMQGRPGVQYSLNLIDEGGRGWAFASVFVIMVYCVFWMFDSDVYNYPESYQDFIDQWGWKFVAVLIKLVQVLHAGVICYPLFQAITLRRHLLMNVVGLAYMIAWIYYLSRKYAECNPYEQYVEYDVEPNLHIAQDIPQILSTVLLTISFTLDLVTNIYKLSHRKEEEMIDPSEQFHQLKPIIYLRQRLKRKTYLQMEPSSSKHPFRRGRGLACIKLDGLSHSPRVVCTVAVAAVVMLRFLIEADHTCRHIRGEFFYYINLFKPLIDLLSPNPNMYEEVVETFNTLYWSFYSSLWSSFLLHLFFGIHMTFTYRKHTRQIMQGKFKWKEGLKDGPVSTVVAGMRYSGYQIVYLLIGFLILMIGQSIGSIIVAYLIVLPLKHWDINFVLEYFVDLLPVIFVGIVIFSMQLLLVKLYFVQENGKAVALDNRRMYHVTSYFLFLPTVLVGLGSVLKRFFVHLALQFILISRMDQSMSDKLDSGHKIYLSMLRLEVTHTHPLLKAFILLVTTEAETSRLTRSVSCKGLSGGKMDSAFSGIMNQKLVSAHEQHMRSSSRARLRWYKAYTLVRNPSLVKDATQRKENINLGISIGNYKEVGVFNESFVPSVSVQVADDDRFTAL